MSVLEIFKNIPRSPYWGATGLKCNFFPSNLQRSPWKKKEGACRPPNGRQAPVAPQGRQASGPARGAGRSSCGRQGGPVAPPRATGSASLYKAPLIPSPHSLLSFDLKNSKKIQKKERGEKKGSGETLPNSALVIYR